VVSVPYDPAHFEIQETIIADDHLPRLTVQDLDLEPMDDRRPGEGATFRNPAPARRPRPGRLARLAAWLLRR
jgi:hypothetical protein